MAVEVPYRECEVKPDVDSELPKDVHDVERVVAQTPAAVVVHQGRPQHVVSIDHCGHRGENPGSVDTERQLQCDGLMEA